MKNIKNVIIGIYLLFPIFIVAQEVKGTVEGENEKLVYANVFLTNQEGEIIKGTVTNDQGEFVLNVSEGDYMLTVSFLGFTEYQKQLTVQGNLNLGVIKLIPDQNVLNEVVVVSKKPMIERKVDRLVFNVENSIAASGGDALGALKVAPGLRVNNGDISMIGKDNVRVMVNNRMVQLSGDDLANFLAGISSDDLKKIEIITNPPSKYEASGNSGIINIVYKKGIRNSWNNSTTLTHTQSVLGFSDLRNTFSYNKGNLRFLGNLSGRTGDMQVIETADLFYPNETWRTSIERKDKKDFFFGRAEVDYDLSKKTTIGVQYLYNKSTPDIIDQPITDILDLNNALTSRLITNGLSNRDDVNQSVNAHLITELDTLNRRLSIDLDYFDFKSDVNRSILTNRFSDSGDPLDVNFSARTPANQAISNYSLKIDMEHPIKGYNLTYGTKLSFITTKSGTTFYNTISGEEVVDPGRTNDFTYKENIQAFYASVSKKLSDKWETKLGLRVENTQTEGISITTTKNDYINFFPTFYLSYLKNDNNSFSINYGRRIRRPNYDYLNPFRWYLYSNFYTVGNPFLKPSFNDNFEFSHTFKESLITTVGLYIQSNGFSNVADVDSEDNTLIFRKENFFSKYTLGLSESYDFNKVSWWWANLYGGLFYYIVDFDPIDIELDAITEKLGYYLSWKNTFTLNKSKSLKLDLSYWYSSSFIRNFGEIGSSSSLDLGLKYSLKSNLQLSAGVYDIFKDSFTLNRKTSNGVNQEYTSYFGNRNVRFSLKYNFGNKNIRVRSRRLGNSDERKRTGI